MPDVRVEEVGQWKLDRVNAILANVGNGSGAFKAIGAALKRAGDSAKTQAGRYASETYYIDKRKFMSNCRITSELKGDHNGVAGVELNFSGRVIRLIDFSGTSGGPQGGVKAGPKRNVTEIRRAFINTIYDEKAVYERVGKARFPVEQLYGPSTGHMMQDEGVSEKLTAHIESVFDQRIEHEITRILSGW